MKPPCSARRGQNRTYLNGGAAGEERGEGEENRGGNPAHENVKEK